MELFAKIILVFTYIAIVAAALEVYLKINKIWKRKHEKHVAESQSILALCMAILVMFVWIANFIVKRDFEAISDSFIYLVESVVLIVIGSGYFVHEKRKTGESFFKLVFAAIKMERGEATYLWKAMVGKGQAKSILTLLQQLAWVDDDFAPKEKELIEKFARKSGMSVSKKDIENFENPHSKTENENERYQRIQNTLKDFLEKETPGRKQAMSLKKLLLDVVNADGKIDHSEDKIIGELDGIILSFLGDPVPEYFVIVVPQQDDHKRIIQETMIKQFPGIELNENEKKVYGGIGYVIYKCYSETYAEYVADQERERLQIMTVVKMEMKASRIKK